MRTSSRLDQVFRNAFPVPFDDKSRFVFFSDVHRGDDSISDEFGRNRHIYDHALDYYYNQGYTYVEVGDGDELWEHPHYNHILTAYQGTFERLKKFYDSGKLFLLYGNHNLQLRNPAYVKRHLYTVYDDTTDEEVDLFKGITVHEALILKHRETDQEIFVVHGHQGDLPNDQLWRISCFLVRYLWRFLHLLGVRYAASPAKNRLKRHKVEKHFTKWNDQHKIMLICGHTHRPKMPRPGEPAYFNTGCCMHPRGMTCLELANGKITLASWRVSSKEDGLVFIRRAVLQGPTDISEYHALYEDREGLTEDFTEGAEKNENNTGNHTED